MDSDDVEYYGEVLRGAGKRIEVAKDALAEAERSRRVDATIAVRAGYGKVATAADLGISRPTLDAWLSLVSETPEELAAVEEHEKFVERHKARQADRRG